MTTLASLVLLLGIAALLVGWLNAAFWLLALSALAGIAAMLWPALDRRAGP